MPERPGLAGAKSPFGFGSLAFVGLTFTAVALGTIIAWIDSAPGWDDTGVTAALLLVGSALIAAVAGRRPWLWALLVGAPLPIVEVARQGAWASIAALIFAASGATIGWLGRRALTSGEPAI